jgi:ABC transporter with metal-binding/Fe-S-binding domain ATP-binding protein
MKLAVLFSGGKDSCYAMYKAMQKEDVVCIISVLSENKESYMFHTPNISIVEKQAEAIGIPLILKKTKGEKEKELKDLRSAIKEAKDKYKIEGIVTGAIESVYQAIRVQKICDDLKLWCFNPLWQIDQIELLDELIENKFEIIISGVFAEPFDESFLGKKIDNDMVKKLKKFADKYKINPSGEGGEIETTVLYAPFFKKRIVVKDFDIEYSNYSGNYMIKKVELT